VEITGGNAIDIHEIDGASNRGIQEIRELKENIRFFPTKSRYKIIIIDEVHMLTTEAFNALLKTLEEPPEHVFFMFATTELHKIPITILSRCQRYELQKVTSLELFEFFSKIAREEKVKISDWALNVIVREAGGSVRDGLSLLDQIFSFSGDEITNEDVTQVLGLVDSQVVSSLAGAVLSGNLADGLKILDNVTSYGVDLKRLSNDLLYYFRALLICRISKEPEKLLDVPDQEFEEMRKTSAQYTVETLQLNFNLLLKGAEEIQYSSHPRLALEMALIRAAETGNIVPVTQLLERLEGMQGTGIAEPVKTPPKIKPLTPMTAAKQEAKKETVNEVKQPEISEQQALQEKVKATTEEEVEEVAEELKEEEKREVVEPAVEEAPQEEAPREEALPPKDIEETVVEPGTPPPTKEVRKHWDEFIEYVMDRKKWMAHTLRLCSNVRVEETDLVLKFDDPSDCKMMQTKENIKFLTEFSQDFFQKEFKIVIKIRGADAGGVINEVGNGPQEERRALANDPLVQMATEVLGGRVVKIRTGPRSR
jgi:DNA polymerase-3 subunit gamma/tau